MNRFLTAAAVFACLLPRGVLASDFIDTRLSFVFADDNVLVKPGETIPNSPGAGFGAGQQNTQFYDNFNTKFTGFETLSNVSLYKAVPSFFEGLTTEAALNLLAIERPGSSLPGVSSGSVGVALMDNSSYVRLVYRPPAWGDRENISFTGFPVSADRFRLGYAYKITWGGSGVFTANAQQYGVPGVKLQIQRDTWYAFAGMKTAILLNELIHENVRQYGFLGGAGIDVLPTLRLEAGVGYFQKGIIPGLAQQGIEAPVNSLGASAEVVLHQGAPVGVSVDLQLYKNDPDVYVKLFTPEKYPGGVSYTISLEASHLVQTLENPDVFAQTVPQTADALALHARLKIDYLRLNVLALYRTLSFIQYEVPGLPPFTDFPQGTELSAERWAAVGADYNFPRMHITPGIIFGVQLPAYMRAPQTVFGSNSPTPGLTGARTIVLRDVNLVSILGPNDQVLPIYSAKATFRWDLSESVAAIGELYYTRDPNRTTFKDDITGISQVSFQKEDAIGFNTILQARF